MILPLRIAVWFVAVMLSFASVHAEGSKEFKKLKLALHQSNSMEDYEDLEDWWRTTQKGFPLEGEVCP